MKFYESISELPIYNWNELNTSGDLKWLLKEPKKLNKTDISKLVDVYDSMQKDIFEKFGKTDSYQEYLQELKRYMIWKIDGRLGDPASKIYAKQFEEEEKRKKKIEFHETMALLQKKLGFYVDSKTMTTLDYFTHLHLKHG